MGNPKSLESDCSLSGLENRGERIYGRRDSMLCVCAPSWKKWRFVLFSPCPGNIKSFNVGLCRALPSSESLKGGHGALGSCQNSPHNAKVINFPMPCPLPALFCSLSFCLPVLGGLASRRLRVGHLSPHHGSVEPAWCLSLAR